MKKALINNRLYDVVSMQEYSKNQDLYNPRFTAIEGHGKVLPIKNRNETGVGIYYQNGGAVCSVEKPDPEDHSYNDSIIIDYSDCKTVKDVIQKDNLVRDIENEILTNKDNIFNLNIRLLKGKSITLGKLISTCNNFDISAEITLRDREGCANPMNSEIKINLTEGRD